MIPDDKTFMRIITFGIMILLIIVGLMASLAYGEEGVVACSTNLTRGEVGQDEEGATFGRFTVFDGFSQCLSSEFNRFTNHVVENEAKAVEIQLSSPGGDLFALFSMLDNVDRMRNAGVTVLTRASGLCASACAILFCYGDVRTMGRASYLMFHALSHKYEGLRTLEAVNENAEHLNLVQRQINDQLAHRLGLDVAVVDEIMQRDTWFSASEARNLGIATSIE